MSSSEAVALYQNAHPKLAYYLTTAIVAGILAIPTGMLVTKLLAMKVVPTAMAPAALQPTEVIPSRSAPAKGAAIDAAPSAALPTESASRSTAPSTDEPATIVPPAPAPAATMSIPESTSTLPPEADRIPDLAVAPSAAGNAALGRPSALRIDRAHATAHAAVLAMSKILGSRRSGAQPARRAGKEGPARHGSGGRTIGSPQPPVGVAAMQQAASALPSTLDHRGGRSGVLGGPATDSASNAGLNGTGMRHRL